MTISFVVVDKVLQLIPKQEQDRGIMPRPCCFSGYSIAHQIPFLLSHFQLLHAVGQLVLPVHHAHGAVLRGLQFGIIQLAISVFSGIITIIIRSLKPLGFNDRIFALPWGNEDTQTLIDILGKYNIKVTFFVVGEWVDKYPESVKALADAGHEIMNHSNDHAHFNSLSAEEIAADINTCNDKIQAVTGVRPTLFRPPYGEYDDHVISAVRGMGMEPIQWDVEALAAASRV